jgi:hypothetical protein
MVAFSFRSSALLLPSWLCASLVVVALLVDGAHASTSQEQTQLRAGTNRYLQEVVLTSDAPSSNVPSHVPNAAPSGLPSDVPSQVPSVAPSVTFSGLTSDGPSLVPNVAPSGLPSDVPSQVPSVAPSVTFSAAISEFPSRVPSDIPSGTPSDVPSSTPSLVPGATPTLKESAHPRSSPSAKPSGNPTYAPTPRPSGAPSLVPSSMPSNTPSAAPSYATEYVAVDALNLRVNADSIMDTATIAMFEKECSAFLPTFLPAVYPAKFQFAECEVISQSLVDMPASRRRLEEGGQDLRWLAVLVRVLARADLPSNVSFKNLVGKVFEVFGSTLQLNLNGALPYFASTLASDTVSASTRGDTGSDSNAEEFPITPVVAAVVVGAVFAIGMAAFMLFVKRIRTDATLPRRSTTDSVGSIITDGDIDDDDETKMGTQFSESTNGPFLPPTPIGVHSVPDDIDCESFVESEDGISPDSTSSASRDTYKYQYPGSYLHVLGLGRTETNFDRSKMVRQGSARAMATAEELERSFDSTYVDDTDGDRLGQSVSAVDRSFHAVRRKTRDEGKLDMDVMKLIGSGSPTVAAGNETLATSNKARDQLVVNPPTQITFFGVTMGGDYARD